MNSHPRYSFVVVAIVKPLQGRIGTKRFKTCHLKSPLPSETGGRVPRYEKCSFRTSHNHSSPLFDVSGALPYFSSKFTGRGAKNEP